MTRPPCVRLCPAYPGNPRTRIEGESPPLCKGTYGLRACALGRARMATWPMVRDAAQERARLLTMRSLCAEPQPHPRGSAQGRCQTRNDVDGGNLTPSYVDGPYW